MLKTSYSTRKAVTDLSYKITGCAITVHKELGPGLLESVYEKCLLLELEHQGYQVKRQQVVPIIYRGEELAAELRFDLLVEDTVIVEVKAVENLHPIYEAQLLSYMKLMEKPQGLLINFHSVNIVKGMRPMVNEYFEALLPE